MHSKGKGKGMGVDFGMGMGYGMDYGMPGYGGGGDPWQSGYDAGYSAGYEAGRRSAMAEATGLMMAASKGKGAMAPEKGGGKGGKDGPPLPAVKATPELHAEVERFIEENELENEKAGKALREVVPSVQRYVLDLGSLDGCRSRSAGCLGRITKAQSMGISAAPPVDSRELNNIDMVEVTNFCTENALNERATNALMSASAAVQRAVIELGSLSTCRDPSAGLLGRLRDLQTGKVNITAAQTGPQRGAQLSPDEIADLEVRVEAFIEEHELNEKATNALRTVPSLVQKQVLDLGSLTGCRSASAGCLGRIQKLQSGAGQGHSDYTAMSGPQLDAEVESFIANHGLNDKASNALRTVGPAVQRQVLDLGSLQGCREPSAGCLGRIRDIQCGQRDKGGSKGKSAAWGYSPY